jgi:hypothetical protein
MTLEGRGVLVFDPRGAVETADAPIAPRRAGGPAPRRPRQQQVEREQAAARRRGAAGKDHLEPAPVVTPARGPILLVEDESAVRRLAELALRAAGFAVHAAESGDAALAALSESEDGPPPLALVSDVSMAGMDGLELAPGAAAVSASARRPRLGLYRTGFRAGSGGGGGGAFPRQAVWAAGVGGGGRYGACGGTMTARRGAQRAGRVYEMFLSFRPRENIFQTLR